MRGRVAVIVWCAASLTLIALPALRLPVFAGQPALARHSPVPREKESYSSISVADPSDGWAVGAVPVPAEHTYGPLARHWDGATWVRTTTPALGVVGGFHGVYAAADGQAWAVGSTGMEARETQPLIEHWDGSTWSVVPDPPHSGQYAALVDTAGTSSDDVWAVGAYIDTNQVDQALAIHWDGNQWVDTGAVSGGDYKPFTSVSVIGPDDVWAVGYDVTEHWDGKQWSIVPISTPTAHLKSISGTSPADVWTVGSVVCGQAVCAHAEHWNGKRWSTVSTPNGTYGVTDLVDVKAVGRNQVWAVGGSGTNTFQFESSIIEHWDGHTWAFQASYDPLLQNGLVTVDLDSAQNGWTIGESRKHLGGRHHISCFYHWDGSRWGPSVAQ